MTREEAIDAIEEMRRFQTETTTLEAKTATVDFPKKCYDTISGFSNKYGGIIIFGLNEKDNFKTENVYDMNDLQKKISSLCSDSMEPAIRPEILPFEYEGKNLLAVKINEINQMEKPCFYKLKGMNKGSYLRIADRDEVMTDYEIYSLQSYHDSIQEDLRPMKRASMSDLNAEKLKKYIATVRENKPNFSKSSDEKILKLCGIVENSDGNIYPTLTGLLLFGEYPQAYYPQLFVACTVIPGVSLGEIGEMGQRFDDNKRVLGND